MKKQHLKHFIKNRVSKELEQFVIDYKNNPIFKIPNNPYYDDYNATLITLYQDDEYKVELFVAKPNCKIPLHRHPNMEAWILWLDGEGSLFIGTDPNNLHTITTNAKEGKFFWFSRESWHGFETTDKPLIFINIERWFVQPTHIANDWLGIDGSTSPKDGRY